MNTEDRFALGIVAIYALFCVGTLWSKFRETTADPAVDRREQVLDRLEQGETVRIERWHGHDLAVSGELILDTDELGDEE